VPGEGVGGVTLANGHVCGVAGGAVEAKLRGEAVAKETRDACDVGDSASGDVT